LSERSLVQETVCRLEGIEDVAPPIMVCNEEHRFLVAEHLRQLEKDSSPIILEPEGRNTAPALSLAALFLNDTCQCDPSGDPVMLVMPADHVMKDVTAFQSAVEQGIAYARQGALVTFGIVPTAARTGFGYIKKGEPLDVPVSIGVNGANDNGAKPSALTASQVETFVEKPDAENAQRMVDSGEYLWNSGIFMMKVSVWLKNIKRFRPDIFETCSLAQKDISIDGDFIRPDHDLFASCPSDSIDYAVMENVTAEARTNGAGEPGCVVISLDAGWSDLGAWSAIWEEADKDANGNMIEGDVHAYEMKDSLLIGQHRLVAAVGLENVIIVETSDAVLVASKDKVQDVKNLVTQLKSEKRSEQEHHRKVHRPWGSYESMDKGSRFQVKRLTVKPGEALSLQMHHHRAEHWVVVNGTAKVTKGDETFLLTENQSTYVPVGVTHRLENPGTLPLEIVEVQTGSYTGEDDIVRLEDRYNRQGAKNQA
jgi:mannose-1-phosphate guanylyltransferase/mannose-6-phosphate isomerase